MPKNSKSPDKAYVIGHEVYFDIEKTWFKDNNEIVKAGAKRECPTCKKVCEIGKPDACLGYLPGVNFACCGHGVEEGYISFKNGTIIRFYSPCYVEHIPQEIADMATKISEENNEI